MQEMISGGGERGFKRGYYFRRKLIKMRRLLKKMEVLKIF